MKKLTNRRNNRNDTWLLGAILAVFGLYTMIFDHNIGNGFTLIGLGVAFMAVVDARFRKQFFEFIFSIFKSIAELAKKRNNS